MLKRATCVLAATLLPGPAGAFTAPPDWSRFEGRTVTAIALEGNKTTRDSVIARELQTAVARPFQTSVLAGDVTRLVNLQVFAAIEPELHEDGQGVKLLLRLTEMPAIVPFPTFTYTEENGFSYGLAVSALNLAGQGIRLSGRAYFGGTTQYWGKLSWPWVAGNHLSLDLYGAKVERHDRLNGFGETSAELTPAVGTYLGKSGRLEGALSWFEMRSDTAGTTLSPDLEDNFVRAAVTFGYDTRDSWREPARGWRNELEIWRTWGDGDFWTVNLDVRRYQPTFARQGLLLSGLLTLQSGEVGVDVPQYLTYHVGGANSVRGYDIDDLTSEDNGKNQLLATAEYNFTLAPVARRNVFKWAFSAGLQATVFSDAGIAWSHGPEFGWNRMRGGVGAGLRVLVPGSEQIRFDVGWSARSGLRFHFAGGTKPDGQRKRLR